jgi:hypothetical protein
MPCLLYCVTLTNTEFIANLVGVSDQPVQFHDSSTLRIYWSAVANPETLTEGPARKSAEQKFRQMLRAIVLRTTPISFPFPAVLPDLESLDKLVAEEHEKYKTALTRLAETVQYDLIATWAADDQSDLATPVSGREYLKRRQEAEARVAAIDTKLKTVTASVVREWRSRQDRRKHLWFALMSRDDRDRFVAALRSSGPSEGVRLRLSGPWPPREFVAPKRESQ